MNLYLFSILCSVDLSKCYTCSKRMINKENLNYEAYAEITDVHMY